MPTTFEVLDIRDGIARVYDMTLRSEAPMEHVLPLLGRREAIATPILPRGTILAAMDPNTNNGIIVVERTPERVTLSFDEGTTVYRVPMPYLYFIVGVNAFTGAINALTDSLPIGGIRLYMSDRPIRSGSQYLYVAPIPNVGQEDGYICWGGTYNDEGTIGSKIDYLINSFFATDFNGDLGENHPSVYGDISEWAEAPDRDFERWHEFDSQLAGAATLAQLLDWDSSVQPNWGMVTNAPPQPPPMFTVASARRWAQAATPRDRRTMLTALTQELAALEDPEA